MGRHKSPTINRRRIEKVMKRIGMTRKQLAKLMAKDVGSIDYESSYQSLSRCFRLRRMASRDLERMCRFLGISFEYATAPDESVFDIFENYPDYWDTIEKNKLPFFDSLGEWQRLMICAIILDLHCPGGKDPDLFTQMCLQVVDEYTNTHDCSVRLVKRNRQQKDDNG